MTNATSNADTVAKLLEGDLFTLRRPYAPGEETGVLILAIISCISATAVTGLLLAIAISAFNTRKSTSRNLFVRSHVAAYFICMLSCELVQTIGSIMNVRWFSQMAVTYGPYCTTQGVLKHLADVGTAYWSLIIATNTFWILFLRWKLRRVILISAFVGGWSTIGFIVSVGPGLLQKVEKGPFYAISGYWCWISDEYPSERITLDYMIMFLSALLSFIMYILVYLRLRGNIMLHGWRVSFRFGRRSTEYSTRSVDSHAVNVAKSMLLYPLAYTILLLPIAVSRFVEWTGHEVPFAVTIFCDAIFLLSGCVNVALFLTTRRVLPAGSVIPRSISQRFRTPSRSNTEQSICTPSTAAFTDVEKMIYAEQALSRTDSMGSESMYKVSTRTSTQYPETPVFSVGEPAEEYDDVALDSARLGSEPAWKPAVQSPDGLERGERLDISAREPRRVSSEPSPTIPVAIPTGAFRPFGDESGAL
ncbi:hypothetical protein VTO73DRAFT_7323 [Trametes versicolor]